MPRYHVRIDGPARSLMNTRAAEAGPIDTYDRAKLAGYMGYAPRTVDAWFRPSSSGAGRLLRRNLIGTAPCELNQEEPAEFNSGPTRSDDTQRDRLNLACCLMPEGMFRDGLYTGRPYQLEQPMGDIAQSTRFLRDLFGGAYDNQVGFRLSKAWSRVTLTKTYGTAPIRWLITIEYSERRPQDESDPEEVCPEEE